MKCLIVKVKDRKRTPTYKKMISGKDVYSFPSNLDDAIEYSSSTLHEENEWYMYNVPLVKTQMKKIIVTAKTLYSHPKNVSKIYAALHTDLAW